MPDPLTLMAVHAHPDDECIGTGGVLARYSDQGVRTVLVTCTNGELGDGPGGEKPGEPGHDPKAVAVMRLEELRRSCEILGIDHLELLDYHDSGMEDWTEHHHASGSFWSTPVDEAAGRLAELIERYQPQVMVTYDENGFYGHPDHIQANRITLRAAEMTGIPAKIYYNAVPLSAMRRFGQIMREAEVEMPEDAPDFEAQDPPFGTPDELVTTWIDATEVVERKREAMVAHTSQISETSFFLALPEQVFKAVFANEAFVRHFDRTGAPVPEDDLFAGLRD